MKRPNRNRRPGRRLLRRIEKLIELDPAAESPQGRCLIRLAARQEAWERKRFPIGDDV